MHSLLLLLLLFLLPANRLNADNMDNIYEVIRLEGSLDIDARWDKPRWREVEAGTINNFMGDVPGFIPEAHFKMMYDCSHLYVIFRVKDQYVLCENENIHDPVWEDSCVEFFFAPDIKHPLKYFNLEINCAGVPLMNYNTVPREEFTRLEISDIEKIKIAHSIPGPFKDEKTEPVTWTIEYSIPLDILEKYSEVTKPEEGVIWMANFYKIAVNTSNPHYMTWSPVKNEKPDFHLPAFFGKLKFK